MPKILGDWIFTSYFNKTDSIDIDEDLENMSDVPEVNRKDLKEIHMQSLLNENNARLSDYGIEYDVLKEKEAFTTLGDISCIDYVSLWTKFKQAYKPAWTKKLADVLMEYGLNNLSGGKKKCEQTKTKQEKLRTRRILKITEFLRGTFVQLQGADSKDLALQSLTNREIQHMISTMQIVDIVDNDLQISETPEVVNIVTYICMLLFWLSCDYSSRRQMISEDKSADFAQQANDSIVYFVSNAHFKTVSGAKLGEHAQLLLDNTMTEHGLSMQDYALVYTTVSIPFFVMQLFVENTHACSGHNEVFNMHESNKSRYFSGLLIKLLQCLEFMIDGWRTDQMALWYLCGHTHSSLETNKCEWKSDLIRALITSSQWLRLHYQVDHHPATCRLLEAVRSHAVTVYLGIFDTNVWKPMSYVLILLWTLEQFRHTHHTKRITLELRRNFGPLKPSHVEKFRGLHLACLKNQSNIMFTMTPAQQARFKQVSIPSLASICPVITEFIQAHLLTRQQYTSNEVEWNQLCFAENGNAALWSNKSKFAVSPLDAFTLVANQKITHLIPIVFRESIIKGVRSSVYLKRQRNIYNRTNKLGSTKAIQVERLTDDMICTRINAIAVLGSVTHNIDFEDALMLSLESEHETESVLQQIRATKRARTL